VHEGRAAVSDAARAGAASLLVAGVHGLRGRSPRGAAGARVITAHEWFRNGWPETGKAFRMKRPACSTAVPEALRLVLA